MPPRFEAVATADPDDDGPRPTGLPGRFPIFYGHVVVAAAIVGFVSSTPGQTYGVSLFVEELMADLDLSRSQIASIYTAATLVGSVLTPLAGRILGRLGARLFLSVSVALMAGACAFMAAAVDDAPTLFAGFLMLRFLGQGCITLGSTVAIANWWSAWRGTAMGIGNACRGFFGFGVFNVAVAAVLGDGDWRTAFGGLAFCELVVVLPLVAGFVRSRPEPYGLVPDGRAVVEAAPKGDAVGEAATNDFELGEALRTAAFKVFAGSCLCFSTGITALIFHLVSILSDQGVDASAASGTLFAIGVGAATLNVVSGRIVDAFSVRETMLIALCLESVCLYLAGSTLISSEGRAIIFGALLGMAHGTYTTTASAVWANLFGRRHLAAISSFGVMLFNVGSALGPIPFALYHDAVGNFSDMMMTASLIPALLACGVAVVPFPKR